MTDVIICFCVCLGMGEAELWHTQFTLYETRSKITVEENPAIARWETIFFDSFVLQLTLLTYFVVLGCISSSSSLRLSVRGGRLAVCEQTEPLQSRSGASQQNHRNAETAARPHLPVSSWNWTPEHIPLYHGKHTNIHTHSLFLTYFFMLTLLHLFLQDRLVSLDSAEDFVRLAKEKYPKKW